MKLTDIKIWTLVVGWIFLTNISFGQGVGVSFSFFFPKEGELSIPVSPFSYRGVALPFNQFTGIQTGGTLYRMGGISIKNLPFKSEKPFLGPNLTLYVPLELYFKLTGRTNSVTFKAGGFGFGSVFNKLNEGNIDRAIRELEGWEVANSDLTFKNKPGWGYQGGVEYLMAINRKMSLTFEVNYLVGSASIPISGSYTGGTSAGLESKTVDYPQAKVNFTGLELSVGAVFN